jgi:hypothetical protein
VVCCEVLEHLTDPARALGVLARLAQPSLIVSVPREPLWRMLNMARGRYWRALGNTPGHLQHWSAPSFLALLEAHVEVREVRMPLPWTMRFAGAGEAQGTGVARAPARLTERGAGVSVPDRLSFDSAAHRAGARRWLTPAANGAVTFHREIP